MADELDLELDLESGSPSVAGDVAAAAPRGLAKGVTGLAGMPGDMLSMANKAGDWVNEKLGVPGPKGGTPGDSSNPFVPTSAQLRSTIEEVTGNWGEAKTTPGKYMESVTSMIPSSMLGGGGLLVKGAAAVGGGVGAEAGGELSALAGFGETPGKIVGGMLGGGLGGAATAARTPRPDFEETFSTFQRLGLTPTAATTGVGGKVSQWLEANALPQAIGSANRMQKTMEGNLTQFTKKQQEIAANFGAPKAKTAEMGEDLQKTVLKGWQGRKEEAGKIFNAIGQAFGPTDTFFPSNLFRAVNKPLGSASTKEVQAMTNAPEIQELDQLLTKTNGHLSYSDMIALKSKFGDMLDPQYAKPVNKAQISQVVEALDRDIEGTIKTLGNKDVVRDWQYAKATYANAMQDYKQAFKKLLGTREQPVNAERVYDIMVRQAGTKSGADMESLKRVWGQLGKAKQGDLSATVLSHMGNKDPSKLGDMEGFSLPTFLTGYKNLSVDAKDMMFRQTGNHALEKSLDDLVLAADKMGVWPALASSSRSGTVGGMMAQMAAPAVFAATGKFSEAAKALLLNIGGPAAASTVLTDPKWVKRLAYAMDKVHGAMTGSTKALLGVVSQSQMEDLLPSEDLLSPQQNPGGGNQIPGKQSSLPQQGEVLSDASPDPVRPGAQYATNLPEDRRSPRPGRVIGEGGGGGAIPPRGTPSFLSDAEDSGERINFQSAGAQRGEGSSKRAVAPAETSEAAAKRKSEMKTAYDKLMGASKSESTSASDPSAGRVGFKSNDTAKGAASGGDLSNKLTSAYRSAEKDLSDVQVPISELVKRSGLPKEEVHKWLLEASKRGDVNLHTSTVGYGIPEDQAAAAIHHPAWNDPLVDVVFKKR